MKKSLGTFLILLCLGCAKQASEPSLVPTGTIPDRPSDSTNDSSAARIYLRVDSTYTDGDGQWFFSAMVPNVGFSGSKTLSSDFGDQIELEWGSRREVLQLQADGKNYVLPPTPINASSAGALFSSGVKFFASSGSPLSNQISISSRPFVNPLSPNDPEDYDLSNCFGNSPAPFITWLAGPAGTNFQIQFERNDAALKKSYTGIRDDQGRWNDGIANGDLFRQVISASERAESQSQEFVADVSRVLYRQQALNQLIFNSVPRVKINPILEVVEHRAIFVYYLGSCE